VEEGVILHGQVKDNFPEKKKIIDIYRLVHQQQCDRSESALTVTFFSPDP
jgi:hypothetical protein